MLFITPKEIISVNHISSIDWQVAERWDNVISIILRQVY